MFSIRCTIIFTKFDRNWQRCVECYLTSDEMRIEVYIAHENHVCSADITYLTDNECARLGLKYDLVQSARITYYRGSNKIGQSSLWWNFPADIKESRHDDETSRECYYDLMERLEYDEETWTLLSSETQELNGVLFKKETSRFTLTLC